MPLAINEAISHVPCIYIMEVHIQRLVNKLIPARIEAVYRLIDDNIIVGTGCFYNNHITGLYVLPQYQKRGYGSHIMDCLEAEIWKKYDVSILEASLPAVSLYEHRGYKTVGHGIFELKNDVKLVYEIMEKNLE